MAVADPLVTFNSLVRWAGSLVFGNPCELAVIRSLQHSGDGDRGRFMGS